MVRAHYEMMEREKVEMRVSGYTAVHSESKLEDTEGSTQSTRAGTMLSKRKEDGQSRE